MSNPLRNLPTLNELLDSPQLKGLLDRWNRNQVVSGVRRFLDNLSQDVRSRMSSAGIPTPQELAQKIADWIAVQERTRLQAVINATGVLLPGGYGGPPLADEAVEAVSMIAANYAAVDGDDAALRQGTGDLLTRLTGAEAAFVANTHAAAVVAALTALAQGREVIVPRGQLGAVGPGERITDLLAASGVKVCEVGSINGASLADVTQAMRPNVTAAILWVTPANYLVLGDIHNATLPELAAAARRQQIPLVHDLPAGALVDFSRWGLSQAMPVGASVEAGADITIFRGDELLAGPECGLCVGRHGLLETIASSPLGRAVRAGKMVLAALAATLQQYESIAVAEQRLPLLTLLATSVANLQNRAERLAPQLAASPLVSSAVAKSCTASLRGLSLPGQELPSWCVEVQPASGNIDQLAAKLHAAAPCVVGRVVEDRLRLDLRSVFPRQDLQLAAAFGVPETSAAESSPAENSSSAPLDPMPVEE